MQENLSKTISIVELNNKAWDSRYEDRDSAMVFAMEVKENATNKSDIYYAQLTIAQLLFWKTNESEQLVMAIEALSYFEKTNDLLGISRANIICAGMYDQYGQYEKAMHHAVAAVKIAELIEDENNKADTYTQLGQIYSRTHDYENAILALTKGLDKRKKLKDDKAIASSLNLIARNYVLGKKYEKAKMFYEESLSLREKIGDKEGIPWTYLGLAALYSEREEWEISFDFYKKAERSNPNSDQRFELLCLIGIGKICLSQSFAEDAIAVLNKALSIAERLKIISLESETYQLLAEAYEKNGELLRALFYYKTYNELKQKFLSNEKVNMLKHQQIAFSIENAEKEAEIHRLKNVELKNAFEKIALQNYQLEEKNKEITDSITYAKRIQDAYLPEKKLFNELFSNAFLLYKPKDIVSGDFYWYAKINSGSSSVLFAAADCTGHGVPGAIMSVICCNALNEVVNNKNIYQPDLILNEVRNMVTSAFKQQGDVTQKDGMDISLVRLIFSDDKMKLQYAGANNPLWIVRKGKPVNMADNITLTDAYHLIEIKADKLPVGNHERMTPFTLHEMDVEKGDMLYSFSDGFADQFGGPFGKKFKTKPMKELLLSIQEQTVEEQQTILYNTYTDWKSNFEQIDDMCMIGVRV